MLQNSAPLESQGATTIEECYQWCRDNNGRFMQREMCKVNCDARIKGIYPMFAESKMQKSTQDLTSVSETLENIGDSFYSLADLVSVL